MEDLVARRILVTGGSRGIGLETARILLGQGASVGIVARNVDHVKSTLKASSKSCWVVSADLRREDQIDAVAREAEKHWGGLDGLINNAGIFEPGRLVDSDSMLWQQTMDVNVRAPFLLTQRLLPMLQQGSSPAIVNVASASAIKPTAGMLAYSVSKAALLQLTKCLALELAPHIRVNAVLPSVIDTEIHRARGLDEKAIKMMGRKHPLGRIGRTRDVAEAIAYLLSASAEWITGTLLPVDGGMLLT